jgi:long-chain acyl-CoA synthetase
LCGESRVSYAGPMRATIELLTYNQHFRKIVHQAPNRIAVCHKTPTGYRQITYGELDRQVRGVAFSLLSQGLQRQARVAILSENRPEWVVCYLGIFLAGGIAVPLDPQISPEEWRRLLDASGSEVIFVSGLLLPKLKDAVHGSQLRGRIISFDPVGADDGARCLSDVIERGHGLAPPPELPESRLSDVAVIIYTSGTTGNPKGVMLTQENIVSEISAALQAIRADETDVFLCLLPLQHVLASVINFLLPLHMGGQVVFADTLRRSEILAAMQEAGITILATVPQFFYLFQGRIQEELAHKGMLARKLFSGLLRFNRFCINHFHLSLGRHLFGKIHRTFGTDLRLFVSGGSAFDPKVAQEFCDLGFTILQGYGLTETTGAAAVTRVEHNVIGSVGPALPGVEIAIFQPGQDGVGEVAIRGPIVMKGYYQNPKATAEVMRDSWFLSGDLGWLDKHGNLFITGRKKEVIVLPNGKNIYPDELEIHFEQCPCIKEIAILGIAETGHEGAERLHAVVVPDFDILKAKRIANAREILRDEIARLSHQLPQYKRLMSYQIQKEPLPRTTTRKIKRLELKRMIERGELREAESAGSARTISAEDHELLDSAAGKEVMSALREIYRRDAPINLDMNLELDLGFDSMERIELLASLEQSLGLKFHESFGTEIYTVRDLIRGLQQQTGPAADDGGGLRQSWEKILSVESLEQEVALKPHFSGTALGLFKYAAVRILHLLFKVLFRLEALGLENLPREGPFLICPNHLSYIDPLVVLATLPYRFFKRVFFVGAAEFFVSPHMRLLARVADIFPVDPDAHLLRAMRVGAAGLRGGRILCIFPEGARSFDGRLGPFKKGAAILARELDVPLVPAAICGTHEVWARDSRRIHLHKVKVVFGKPLRASQGEEASPDQADTDELKQAIAGLMETC